MSFTFRMGPYEPLAMKPRTCEHRGKGIPVFPLLYFPVQLTVVCLGPKYLEIILLSKHTLWELRHKDWGSVCGRRLSSVRVRWSAVWSPRPTTYSWVSQSLSQRDLRVREEPMTEPTLCTRCLSLHREKTMILLWSGTTQQLPKYNKLDRTTFWGYFNYILYISE